LNESVTILIVSKIPAVNSYDICQVFWLVAAFRVLL